ncbi:hypothetical protein BDV3_003569 [Batrachochytrium dendrobatidis]|uniref:Uncharacterized protein n=1 Tax=Batrachochytrium dendrobatidis (strain JEL423) TaxID=403673 RepID=A0A177WCX9_BATDL|nr:hypothetical protein BDEG_21935 [Batrachochytrium dendrobatidis JEL423]
MVQILSSSNTDLGVLEINMNNGRESDAEHESDGLLGSDVDPVMSFVEIDPGISNNSSLIQWMLSGFPYKRSVPVMADRPLGHPVCSTPADANLQSTRFNAGSSPTIRYSHVLAALTAIDFICSVCLFVVYIVVYPDKLRLPFPSSIVNLPPIDLMLLSCIRCLLILFFLLRFDWAIRFRIPLICTFISTLYMFFRATTAYTGLAFITLAFQFLISWSELLCYVYVTMIFGDYVWAKDIHVQAGYTPIFDHDENEQRFNVSNLQNSNDHTSTLATSQVEAAPPIHTDAKAQSLDASDFFFPESTAYIATTKVPTLACSTNTGHTIEAHVAKIESSMPGLKSSLDNSTINMCTSAPISIQKSSLKSRPFADIDYSDQVEYSNFQSDRPHPISFHQSTFLPISGMSTKRLVASTAAPDSALFRRARPEQDTFENFIIRRKEFNEACNQLWTNHFEGVLDIAKSQSRDKVLSRFSLLIVFTRFLQHISVGSHQTKDELYRSLNSAMSVCLKMLDISDTQYISVALSSFPSISLNSRMPTFGSTHSKSSSTAWLDHGVATSTSLRQETLFWKLWKLDIECCLVLLLLLRGIFQILDGRDINGAMNLRKSWQLLQKISKQIEGISTTDEIGHNAATIGTHFATSRCSDSITVTRATKALYTDVVGALDLGKSIFCVAPVFLSRSLIVFFKTVGVRNKAHGAMESLFLATYQDNVYAPFSAIAYLSCVINSPLAFCSLPSVVAESELVTQIIQIIQQNYSKSKSMALVCSTACRNIGQPQWGYNIIDACMQLSPPASQTSTRLLLEMGITALLLQDYAHAYNTLLRVWDPRNLPLDSKSTVLTSHFCRDINDCQQVAGVLICGIAAIFPVLDSTKEACYDCVINIADVLASCRQNINLISSQQGTGIKGLSMIRACKLVLEWVGTDEILYPYMLFVSVYLFRGIASIAQSNTSSLHLYSLKTLLEAIYQQTTALRNASKPAKAKNSLYIKIDVVYHLIAGTICKYIALACMQEHVHSNVSLQKHHSFEHFRHCIQLDDELDATHVSVTAKFISYAWLEMAELKGAGFSKWDISKRILLDLVKEGRPRDIGFNSQGMLVQLGLTHHSIVSQSLELHEQNSDCSIPESNEFVDVNPDLIIGSDRPGIASPLDTTSPPRQLERKRSASFSGFIRSKTPTLLSGQTRITGTRTLALISDIPTPHFIRREMSSSGRVGKHHHSLSKGMDVEFPFMGHGSGSSPQFRRTPRLDDSGLGVFMGVSNTSEYVQDQRAVLSPSPSSTADGVSLDASARSTDAFTPSNRPVDMDFKSICVAALAQVTAVLERL